MKIAVQKFTAPIVASGMLVMGLIQSAFANNATNNFGGDIPGLNDLPGETSGVKEMVVKVITAVLNFLALIAVIVIIIAGIRLIVSQGEEEQKEKAKKTIFYALAGLVVVLLARVIVGLITTYLYGEVTTA